MRTLFLCLLSLTALGQGREFPRWQEQAIVTDLIRGRECDSVSAHQAKIIADLKTELVKSQGIEVKLQKVIHNYDSAIVPGLNKEFVNCQREALIYRSESKKYKGQRNLVVLIVIAAEVLRILSGHP